MIEAPPLLSVILTTRDRPRLLPLALRYYREQTYQPRELLVVDDGAAHPADDAAVHAVGGRLLRVPPGTPLGTKLDHGAAAARGTLCQKMDDDDFYGPRFLELMAGSWLAASDRPPLAFLMGFLFFDLARWEIRCSRPDNVPGASLLFARDDWRARPFRALPGDEDTWFVRDQQRRGVSLLPVVAWGTFIAVRHAGAPTDRGHTWTHQSTGETLEQHLRQQPLLPNGPESVLPDWALAVYRELHLGLGQPATRVIAPERTPTAAP